MLQGVSIRAQRWVLGRVEALAGRRASRRQRPEHLRVGECGEREAMWFLRERGYTVVARRWTTGRLRGDLDLIAWEGDALCFVEVKTRSEWNPLEPAEAAIDTEKRRMLRRMGRAYLRGFPVEPRRAIVTRFDVVSVYQAGAAGEGVPLCELVRNAFPWRE